MNTVKSTMNINSELVEEIKKYVAMNIFSSMTEATNEALALLIKEQKRQLYIESMKEARDDVDFIQRTLLSQKHFEDIESEVGEEW